MKKSKLAIIGGSIAIAIIVSLWFTQTQSVGTTNQPVIEQNEAANPKLKVVASFYPLYEFSRNVGGQQAEVSSFIPIGVEPHDWEPSSGDITSLRESNIFIYNGAGFEPYVEQLIDSGEYENITFVESTKEIDLIKSEHDHDFEYDPHVWLDPVLVKHQVMMIKDAMIQADSKNAQYYDANANAYNIKLDELDAKIKTGLLNCKKDTFMPFHNSATYFANRYGLQIFALSGVAPESEATATELKEFVDFVKKNDIKVIFAEDLVDPRLAEVLAEEAGVQVMVFSPLEGLTDEDLAAGKTYIIKMEENLQNLRMALDCQ
ncbi:MAG: metal ABC transporter solute-binding protein, Zn/Mn family [Nitrososphaerota archaeon]